MYLIIQKVNKFIFHNIKIQLYLIIKKQNSKVKSNKSKNVFKIIQ